MVGGFLGAGKSTALAELAKRIVARGLSVGLITNDQGEGLVDTRFLRARGYAVEEIAGGCFCCRFSSLLAAADNLSAANRPDVFLAEPVGSCTDLVASVSYPLRRMYGERYRIAPLTVLVDPRRAMRVLGLESGRQFSRKVVYIYEKQLEEAHLIAINKIDLLSPDERRALESALAERFARADVIQVSARSGEGLDAWLDRILAEDLPGGKAMDLDYAIYGEGEALLGWLNATATVSHAEEFDGNAFVDGIMASLQERLRGDVRDIAHLKLTLSSGTVLGELAVSQLVGNEFVPETGMRLSTPIRSGELIINLRAEADPAVLREAVASVLEEISVPDVRVDDLESFRPGEPQPTHRMEE